MLEQKKKMEKPTVFTVQPRGMPWLELHFELTTSTNPLLATQDVQSVFRREDFERGLVFPVKDEVEVEIITSTLNYEALLLEVAQSGLIPMPLGTMFNFIEQHKKVLTQVNLLVATTELVSIAGRLLIYTAKRHIAVPEALELRFTPLSKTGTGRPHQFLFQKPS